MGTRRGEEIKNRFSDRCTLHGPRPWIYLDAEWSKWAGALIVPANGLGQSLVPARLARGYPLAPVLTLGCVACRSGLACSVDFRPRGLQGPHLCTAESSVKLTSWAAASLGLPTERLAFPGTGGLLGPSAPWTAFTTGFSRPNLPTFRFCHSKWLFLAQVDRDISFWKDETTL